MKCLLEKSVRQGELGIGGDMEIRTQRKTSYPLYSSSSPDLLLLDSFVCGRDRRDGP
jgi:hypothetical protein